MALGRYLSVAVFASVVLVAAGGPATPDRAQAGESAGVADSAESTLSLTWAQQPDSAGPTRVLTGGQMAYNPKDQTTTFFGGQAGIFAELPDDTWVRRDGEWSSSETAVHPDARLDAPMAYDPVRDETVMFGGTSDYLSFGKRDTWTWNGSRWQLEHPTEAPLPRAHPGMAWDPISKRILLYGGFELDNGLWLSDTWAWDGTTWTELHPEHHPPAGWGNYIATAGGRIVDYTIPDYYTAKEHSETWTWTGEDWQQLQTEHSPPPVVAPSVAGDDSNFVLFGGCTRVGTICPTTTWVLHDGDWQEFNTDIGPSDRVGPGFVSTGDGEFLLYGGRRVVPGNPTLDDTWTLKISEQGRPTTAARSSTQPEGPHYPDVDIEQVLGMPATSATARPKLSARAPMSNGDVQSHEEFFGGNAVQVPKKKVSLSYTMVIPALTCDQPRTFQITGQAGLLASDTRRVGAVVREICDDTEASYQYYEFADGGSVRLPFPIAAGDRLDVSIVSDADAVTINTTNRTQGWTTNGVYAVDHSGLDRALLGDIGYRSGSGHPEPVPVPKFEGQRFTQVLVNGASPPAGTTTQVSMLPSYGGPIQVRPAPWQGGAFAPTWNYF